MNAKEAGDAHVVSLTACESSASTNHFELIEILLLLQECSSLHAGRLRRARDRGGQLLEVVTDAAGRILSSRRVTSQASAGAASIIKSAAAACCFGSSADRQRGRCSLGSAPNLLLLSFSRTKTGEQVRFPIGLLVGEHESAC